MYITSIFDILFQTNYQRILRTTKSAPFVQSSDHYTSKLPLLKTCSTENVTTDDEVYEFCGSTSVEVAAAAVVKKRGPPPKRPVPYRESHMIDTRKGQSGIKYNSGLESSFELPLQEAHVSSPMKTIKPSLSSSSQEISWASDPLPRKNRHNLFNKAKAKRV